MTDRNSPVLVLALGHVAIQSQPLSDPLYDPYRYHPSHPLSPLNFFAPFSNPFSPSFSLALRSLDLVSFVFLIFSRSVEIREVQLLVTHMGRLLEAEEAEDKVEEHTSSRDWTPLTRDYAHYFVEPFSVLLRLELSRLRVRSLTRVRVKGTLPALTFNVSPRLFHACMGIVSKMVTELAANNAAATQRPLFQSPEVINPSSDTTDDDLYSESEEESVEEEQRKALEKMRVKGFGQGDVEATFIHATFSVPSMAILLFTDRARGHGNNSDVDPIDVHVDESDEEVTSAYRSIRYIARVAFKRFDAELLVKASEVDLKGKLRELTIEDLQLRSLLCFSRASFCYVSLRYNYLGMPTSGFDTWRLLQLSATQRATRPQPPNPLHMDLFLRLKRKKRP